MRRSIYTKTHTLKKAACGHVKNIRKRGGEILDQDKTDGGFSVKYAFAKKMQNMTVIKRKKSGRKA